MKLLERETHTCNSRTPRLNIQFGFPRVTLSRFIFIFLLFFLKGERERREIRPRLALDSDRFELRNVSAFGTVQRDNR